MEKTLADLSFLKSEDVVSIARMLIGYKISTHFEGVVTQAMITETEAYAGLEDKASHAYGGRKTERTKVMFGEPGLVYVYLCYGMHHLFNIVSGPSETPHAILIRGIKPTLGIEQMERRRNKNHNSKGFSSGPATASQALGIKTQHSGILLNKGLINLIEPAAVVPESEIQITPRIGIDYAEEDALLPYRFIWNTLKRKTS